MSFCRPKILLSACLNNEPCRYDGTGVNNPVVSLLATYVDFIKVCPETAMGLSTPRSTLRLVDYSKNGDYQLIMPKTKENHTLLMHRTIEDTLMPRIKENTFHGAILKSRSPSCGVGDAKVYEDIEKAPVVCHDHGLFTQVIATDYPNLPIEHEGRLSNYNIRYRYLTHIFALASLEEVTTMKQLIDFHSDYKYLFMSYSPGYLKKLGQIVANHEKKPVKDLLVDYKHLMMKLFSVPTKVGRNINMLHHLFGYFSNELKSQEKAYFLDILQDYHSKRIPFSVPLNLIYSWTIRFNEEYLMRQKIFNPFPADLNKVNDSGKGRI